MTINDTITKTNIRDYVTCIVLHHSTEYATATAAIIADQWNHKEGEIQRNIKSMKYESRDDLPCHLALLLKFPNTGGVPDETQNDLHETISDSNVDAKDVKVVGHVKLVRAAGRGDGSSCISYSLVVPRAFQGIGLGRILTEEAENYVRSLGISYMYLSTPDKATFYEHLGYKQCDPISSMGNNSKRLNPMQLNALENLIARKVNVAPTGGNTWLRKRLIQEYPLNDDAMDLASCTKVIAASLYRVVGGSEDEVIASSFVGFMNRVRWQQQTGPSCGISALNMVRGLLNDKHSNNNSNNNGAHSNDDIERSLCNCVGQVKCVEPNTDINSTLEFAMQSGMTNDGEMFCSYNLAYVGDVYCKMKLKVKEMNNIEGSCDNDILIPLEIVRHLCKGYPVLIPYDRNNYYAPCEVEGKMAHWAVIVGFILPGRCYKDINLLHPDLKRCKEAMTETVDLELYDIHEEFDVFDNIHEESLLGGDLLLVCMHGMSEKPFACTYQSMADSNGQLKSSKSKFYLASEGLLHLRHKIIFVDH